MLEFTEQVAESSGYDCRVSLTYDQRKRGRLKVELDDGRSAGIFLERGGVLAPNSLLKSTTGEVAKVLAEPETLACASHQDGLLLAKVCYHLGNRHTPLEITANAVYFQPDHVLSELCRDWGMQVNEVSRPFNPESGAYGAHGGHHHHD